MKKIVPSGFENEYYVVIETEEYMIFREVRTGTEEIWVDSWMVLDLDERNWSVWRKSPLYMYAESFELALVCGMGIAQRNKERNKERPVKKEVPEGIDEVHGDVPEIYKQ